MFSVSSNNWIFQGLIFFKVHKIMNPQTAKLRNPAHRRPWPKWGLSIIQHWFSMRLEGDFSSLRCVHIPWLNSIGKLAKWCFRLRETIIFMLFLKWRNYFVYASTCFFFSSSDSINPAAAGLPSVPRIRSGSHCRDFVQWRSSSVASTCVRQVHER